MNSHQRRKNKRKFKYIVKVNTGLWSSILDQRYKFEDWLIGEVQVEPLVDEYRFTHKKDAIFFKLKFQGT